MFTSILLWSMLIAPWLSLFAANKKTIKRFMPVSILSALLVTIAHEAAYSLDWWAIENYIVPWGFITNISLAYGLFAVGTFWIFNFTYGSLLAYVLLNAAVDGLWLIFVPPLLEQADIFRFVNLDAWQLFLICMALAYVLYGYQVWLESMIHDDVKRNRKSILMNVIGRLFKGKERGK